MLLLNASPPDRKNYEAHQKIAKVYGAKAAGLSFLPKAWRLDFAALSIAVHNDWIMGGVISKNEEIVALGKWLTKEGYNEVILRSSGTSETLQDRGKYKSIVLPSGWTTTSLIDQLAEIYKGAGEVDDKARLGIVVQKFVKLSFGGHLSNEYRVSPTINQWSYELEQPNWAPSQGINSKFVISPDPNAVLRCGSQIPHQPLRSVAHYLVDEFKERCHIEWLVHNSTLYLMQLDFEWPQLDEGLDPKRDLTLVAPRNLDLTSENTIKAYRIGDKTKWPKLRNLSEFDFDEGGVLPPKIYPLEHGRITLALSDRSERRKLISEMTALTGDRLVVRTDCIDKSKHSFNLPRTDTISVKDAIAWCGKQISSFEKQGIDKNKVIFLFHAFLPAIASAWAYAKPGSPIVIVDALWGLPDGMQVLPVDTYEVNAAKQKIVQTKTTFKPSFLVEVEGGKWDYRSVKTRSGRGQVLTSADKLEIATRTSKIAARLNDDAQIMWFCNIPLEYEVGRNLPWFRSREILDPSPRQEVQFRPFRVSNPQDLKRIPSEKVTLQLSPEADLIRDDSFLESVISVAKKKNLPVQLEGSILGHAYYRLNQENIPIVLANAPKYYRKRNAQVFGKLVRDKIPKSIAEGGEAVREARLAKNDIRIGLAGKLFEELEEFLKARDEQDMAAELADMLEVLKGLAFDAGHSWSKIERIAKDKAIKKGGFRDGKVLIETALPHRESPIEKIEQVRISDLGKVESRETAVNIPPTALMATTSGQSVIFAFEGDPSRYRLSIKDGKLSLNRLDAKVPETDETQQELFQ